MIYQFTDALTASLFGIFALWAAGSQRHWFVRTVVVGAALLVMLLIPAYDPLIKFLVQILVVLSGLAVWRRHRGRAAAGTSATVAPSEQRGMRVSLETLLLLMAVVAVVTAVAARAPHFAVYEWYESVFVGAMAGVVVLLGVWIVFGRTRLWLRLLAIPSLVYCLSLAMRWLWVSRWMWQHWVTTPTDASQYWEANVNEGIFSGTGYWTGSITIGLAIMCVWLVCVRLAGWFDPFREQESAGAWQPPAGWRKFARGVAVGMFVLVALFPLLLLYKLMTPTAIPHLASQRPNGYDDLLKAGHMISDANGFSPQPIWQMSAAQLSSAVTRNSAALKLAHSALRGDCHFPLVIPETMRSPTQIGNEKHSRVCNTHC
jgi:hypothetical protein